MRLRKWKISRSVSGDQHMHTHHRSHRKPRTWPPPPMPPRIPPPARHRRTAACHTPPNAQRPTPNTRYRRRLCHLHTPDDEVQSEFGDMIFCSPGGPAQVSCSFARLRVSTLSAHARMQTCTSAHVDAYTPTKPQPTNQHLYKYLPPHNLFTGTTAAAAAKPC